MTGYDDREARTRRYYAAVHVDRILNAAQAAMKVADDEQAELRARLARVTEQLRHECPHGEMSWSGVDQADLDDPAKVWACDNCGKVLDGEGR